VKIDWMIERQFSHQGGARGSSSGHHLCAEETMARSVGERARKEGATRLATLSVLKFEDPYGADRVLIALQGLQERQMITLQDAAVVSWPEGNKKPKTRQLHSTQARVRSVAPSGASCSG
jgi:hypothetical protein